LKWQVPAGCAPFHVAGEPAWSTGLTSWISRGLSTFKRDTYLGFYVSSRLLECQAAGSTYLGIAGVLLSQVDLGGQSFENGALPCLTGPLRYLLSNGRKVQTGTFGSEGGGVVTGKSYIVSTIMTSRGTGAPDSTWGQMDPYADGMTAGQAPDEGGQPTG
jgi:hypothetical protein